MAQNQFKVASPSYLGWALRLCRPTRRTTVARPVAPKASFGMLPDRCGGVGPRCPRDLAGRRSARAGSTSMESLRRRDACRRSCGHAMLRLVMIGVPKGCRFCGQNAACVIGHSMHATGA